MKIAEPKFEFVRGELTIRLVDPWAVELENGLVAEIPSGFETDLVSVPRLFRNILSPIGDLRYGAVLHDFGYQYNFLLTRFSPKQIYNRASLKFRRENKEAFGPYMPVFIGKDQKFFDQTFRYINEKAAAEIGQSVTLENNVAYGLLRLFGRVAWNRYRRLGAAAYNRNSLWLPSV